MDAVCKKAYHIRLKDYPDILNIGQLSEALGVSTKTGYRLLREGIIGSIRVGRTYRIPKVYLLSYLQILGSVSKT